MGLSCDCHVSLWPQVPICCTLKTPRCRSRQLSTNAFPAPSIGSLSKCEDPSSSQCPESIQIWVRGGGASQMHLSCSRHSPSVILLSGSWLCWALTRPFCPPSLPISFLPSFRSLGFTKLWNLILDTLTKETRRPETCEAHG